MYKRLDCAITIVENMTHIVFNCDKRKKVLCLYLKPCTLNPTNLHSIAF